MQKQTYAYLSDIHMIRLNNSPHLFEFFIHLIALLGCFK
ncbi:hypothetical protein LPE509_01226 [Legionella pneumophila subsp. pneumophila LPE509]|nr:hypothetical protein LPE509_01226 [Legionella pneumophila subsp. pneumophila LPE509]